jgi:hypothetical protein
MNNIVCILHALARKDAVDALPRNLSWGAYVPNWQRLTLFERNEKIVKTTICVQ